jgi:hypothetical protein
MFAEERAVVHAELTADNGLYMEVCVACCKQYTLLTPGWRNRPEKKGSQRSGLRTDIELGLPD